MSSLKTITFNISLLRRCLLQMGFFSYITVLILINRPSLGVIEHTIRLNIGFKLFKKQNYYFYLKMHPYFVC